MRLKRSLVDSADGSLKQKVYIDELEEHELQIGTDPTIQLQRKSIAKPSFQSPIMRDLQTPAAHRLLRHLAALVKGNKALAVGSRRQLRGRDLEQAALGRSVESAELDAGNS